MLLTMVLNRVYFEIIGERVCMESKQGKCMTFSGNKNPTLWQDPY